ncbi:hydrolase yden [Paenibacillus terrae HPL-003]|uniref:Hydrolase yden n=1 Tax=Paenibacillus terrae (strain HPL-003) TaxID=985665 RepID=G7VR90_PAETH|nr:alpha/beta hydrolase [Paenibacillus terrae]AET61989.1 hydrolase yden [Paenibacillus terrae HPL-003]
MGTYQQRNNNKTLDDGRKSIVTNIQNKKQVYIIHGYTASPSDHWFPWLQDKLQEDGVSVEILEMPNSQSPKLNEWIEHLLLNIKVLHKDTYFIGHSLGCVSILRYLQQVITPEPLGGVVFVSGFTDPVPSLPSLDEFTNSHFDYQHIMDSLKARTAIASKDDTIVPFALSKKLTEDVSRDRFITLVFHMLQPV